ncbi:MAG: molybdopterin-dependent oxidoreductase, partial [Actinobacteria bacterium]|nr:molybdopterin-dependent oxidoreductase [Actinomycetota bacterium]
MTRLKPPGSAQAPARRVIPRTGFCTGGGPGGSEKIDIGAAPLGGRGTVSVPENDLDFGRDRGTVLLPTDWDTALDQVAGRIREIQEAYGPDAVAVFGGGGLTNEKAYLLGKFARVALGTSKIDYNGRFCMSSAAAAGIAAFGLDRGLPFPVTDLDGADVVLLAGANVAETMPPLMSHLRSARLIVIDPRPSATAERALASGGLHLAPAPGTDLALALALFHVIVAEDRYDRPFIAEYTNGFDAARRAAGRWWPERAERLTG